MKCRVCGGEAENPQFRFCRFCGAPVEAAPVEAAPVEATPVEAAPVEAAPVEAVPVEAAPVEAAPVEAAPVEAAPVEAAPVEAAPVEAAPVEEAPVEEAAPVAEDGGKKNRKKKKGGAATAVVAAASALVLLGSGGYVAYNNGLISLPSSAGTAEAGEAATLSGSGDHAKAAQLYEKAIEQAPDNAEYYLSAADAYIAAGDLVRAEECLSRGVMRTGSKQLSEKLYTMRDGKSISGVTAPYTPDLPEVLTPDAPRPEETEEAPEPQLPPLPDQYMPVYFEFSPASQIVPDDKSDIDPDLVRSTVISIEDEHYLSVSRKLMDEFRDMVSGEVPVSSSKSYYSHSGRFDDLQNAGSIDNYGVGRPQGVSYEFDENGRVSSSYDYVNRAETTYYYIYDENGEPIRRYSLSFMEEGGQLTNVGSNVLHYGKYDFSEKDDSAQYDDKGRLIGKVSGDVVTAYVYDDENNSRKTLVDGVLTSVEWYDDYGQLLRYEKLGANEVLDGSGELPENSIGKTKRFTPFEKEERSVTYKDGGCIVIYDGAKDITRSWSSGFLPEYTLYSSDYNFVLTHMTAAVKEASDTKAFRKDIARFTDSLGADSVIYRDKDGYITAVEMVKDGTTVETFNYTYTRDGDGYPRALNISCSNDEYNIEFSLDVITCEPEYDDNGNPVSGRYRDEGGSLIGSVAAEYVLWDDDPSDEIAEYLDEKGGEE